MAILSLCKRSNFDTIVCGSGAVRKVFPVLSYILCHLKIDAERVEFVDESFTSTLSKLSIYQKNENIHAMAAIHILDLYLSRNQSQERSSTISDASPEDLN